MALKVGIVIDPWDYPYNGTVVSARRFVGALSHQVDFRLLATAHPRIKADVRMFVFPKLSIPGFNRIIDSMKVPLANPSSKDLVEKSIEGLDLVHMQFPFFLAAAVCRAATRAKIPLICSFHVQPENLLRNLKMNSAVLSKGLYKLFIWAMYQHADLVITPSAFAAEQLRLNGLKRPIEVLSNGVPSEFFSIPRHKKPNGKFQILSVGRFAPEKHQHLILDAVAQLPNASDIEVTLVGAGPLEAELRQQADRLNLQAQIGSVSDEVLLQKYQTSDLFVHAGEIELEGMSVLEAMAAGITVLVSDSKDSAAVELVKVGNSLFIAQSTKDLSNKIDYWITHDDERWVMGEENRVLAQQRHHKKSAEQLLAIYQRYAPLSGSAHTIDEAKSSI